MKQYNLVIDEKLIKEVDLFIKKKGLFSSRSDFIRDAIRSRLIEIKKVLFEEAGAGSEVEHHDEEPSKEAVEAVLRAHDEKKYTGVY